MHNTYTLNNKPFPTPHKHTNTHKNAQMRACGHIPTKRLTSVIVVYSEKLICENYN
jgi:heme oxygenase